MNENPNNLQEYYDSVHSALSFDSDSLLSYRSQYLTEMYDCIIDYLDIKDGEVILDLGCGLGTFGLYLSTKKNVEIFMVTFSKFEFEHISKKINELNKNNIKVFLLDFNEKGFEKKMQNKKFSLVVALESFEHSTDLRGHFRLISTLLEKNGRFFMQYNFVHPVMNKPLNFFKYFKMKYVRKKYLFTYNNHTFDEVLEFSEKEGFSLFFVYKNDNFLNKTASDIHELKAMNNLSWFRNYKPFGRSYCMQMAFKKR